MPRSSTRSSRRKSRAPARPRPARRLRSRTPEELVVAGRGNVGRSLVRAFRAGGHRARLVASRDAATVGDGIVFLAVPDGVVPKMATEIAKRRPPSGVAFVHVSGALGLDALAPLRGDHEVGSFHPLQSFPRPRDLSAFRGITVAVDASSQRLERRLARLARDLGARPRHVGDAERVRYHAAAVFASNLLVVVVEEAVRILRAAGWSEGDAERALMPLVEGAVTNLRSRGVKGALTGPIRRGDAETVVRHLTELNREQADLYRMLGLVALDIAKEAGLDAAAVGRTRRALTRNVAATQRRGRR